MVPETASGLPWYQDGKGILGATLRDKGTVDLLIRKGILETEGVVRVLKLNSLFAAGQREYSIYMQVLLDSGKLVEQTVTVHESVFTAPGMTMSDLTKLMAQNIRIIAGEAGKRDVCRPGRKTGKRRRSCDAFRWKGDDGSTGNRSRCSEHRNG